MLVLVLVFMVSLVTSYDQILEYAETKIYSKYGARKDYFGHAVDVKDGWIVVGAYSSSAFQRDAGAAFSFQSYSTRDSYADENTTGWNEMPYIVGSEVKPHDYFGGSAALDDGTAVVGAYLDENVGLNSGSAYVFIFHNGEWKEQQRLISHNAMAADYFGQSVGIDEDTIVVGAYGQADSGYYRGAAYVFERSHHRWTQTTWLRPVDIQDNHMFGFSVAIFGTSIIVGAYGDSEGTGSNTGSVYLFENVAVVSNFTDFYGDDSKSLSRYWTSTQKLQASDARQYSNFGVSIAGTDIKSSYGSKSTVVVGASTARGAVSGSGAVYLFTSAFSYSDDGDVITKTWSQQTKLYASDGQGDEHFGAAVAIEDNTVVVGAPDDCFYATDAGAVYVFTVGSNSVRRIVGNDTMAYDHFGTDVSINGNIIAIGSEQANGIAPSSGAVYMASAIGAPVKTYKDPTLAIRREKDRFVFIISILPVLLVVIPICVVSFVVYFDRYYARIASVIGARISAGGDVLPLQEYASLHGASSHSSFHGSSSSSRDDIDRSTSALNPKVDYTCVVCIPHSPLLTHDALSVAVD
jgi:hypothetical protein